MTLLLAIDPGKHRSGWALFGDGTLFFAGFDAPSSKIRAYDPTAVPGTYLLVPEPTEMVIERPQVRRMGRSKGDPNDLIDVAIAVGQWIGTYPHAKTDLRTPSEWKGSLDKPKCHARARAVLRADELSRIPELPKTRGLLDMWDAIALGLVHLGRVRMR